MRLASLPFAALVALLGQPGWATPKADARVVVEDLTKGPYASIVRETIRLRYLRDYETALEERSIKILDQNRFAAFLPDETLDSYIDDWRAVMVDHVAASYEPETLAEFANHLATRSASSDLGTLQTAAMSDGPGSPEDWAEGIQEALEDQAWVTDLASEMALVEIALSAQPVTDEKLPIEPRLDAPFMIDVIEADGVLAFPNRIWRKTLVSEIEAANG